MPGIILSSKLYIPQPRRDLLPRLGLIEKLSKAVDHRLTLISAPAGFGKTSLLSLWLSGQELNCGWLTLDDSDSHPGRLLRYFIEMCSNVVPGFGRAVAVALDSVKPPEPEAVLPFLAEEFSPFPETILILDDYHVINNKQTDALVLKLIEMLPQQVHLVISGRSDPAFSLSLLRGRREMFELPQKDLSFSEDEAYILLNEIHNQQLDRQDSRLLSEKTEGWVTGLQLALLGLERADDRKQFIRDFSASSLYFPEYLVEQVFSRQSEEVCDFLLKTSVLDKFCPELCSAVTLNTRSDALLADAIKNNAFISRLDSRSDWFRYHNLFRDLLLKKLLQSDSKSVTVLKKRAAAWFEKENNFNDAVEYYIESEDYESAVAIILKQLPTVWNSGHYRDLTEWIKKIPENHLKMQPHIVADYVLACGYAGRFEEAERCISILDEGTREDSVPGVFELIKAFHAVYVGDIERAKLALDSGSQSFLDDQPLWKALELALKGDVCAFEGKLHLCRGFWGESVNRAKKAGNLFLVHWTGAKLIVSLKRSGKLYAAEEAYSRLLNYSADSAREAIPGAFYTTGGELLLEKMKIDEALKLIKEGLYLSERQDYSGGMAWSYSALINALFVSGDYEQTADVISAFESRCLAGVLPDWGSNYLTAWKTRLLISVKKYYEAEQLLSGVSITDDVCFKYPNEIEYLELLRLKIYSGAEGSEPLIESLKNRFLAADWMERYYETCLLEAVYLEKTDQHDAALNKLRSLIEMSEPEGYIKLYLSEGTAVSSLLYELLEEDEFKNAVGRILSFSRPVSGNHAEADPLVDPLSHREREVLNIIARGKSNKETADVLFISTGTVKNHLKNIFSKMNVKSRTEAVDRGRMLGLVK